LHHGLADLTQAQRAQAVPLLARPADLRLDLGDLQVRGHHAAPWLAAACAATVACTTLIGLDEPSERDSTSLIPAHSSTARTGPPAITPVPGLAGLSS